MCMGIGFTMLSGATMLYVSSDVVFSAPFVGSAQSPEGISTYMFPSQFGTKFGNEILLTDKVITAQVAVQAGFANGIIDKLDPKKDWFDPNIVPVIPKLLDSDGFTLMNTMELINLAKERGKFEMIAKTESEYLIRKW